MRRRIEVLVVISAATVLAAFGMRAVSRARESARQSSCMNNMRQLCMGLVNYHEAYSAFPSGTVGNPARAPENRWSFYPNLMPWLEQAASPPIDYMSDSRDSRNWLLEYEVSKQETFTISLHAPGGITCPSGDSRFGEHEQIYAGYVGVTGIGAPSPVASSDHPEAGIWGYDRRTSTSEITAGLANTLLLIEAELDRDVWLLGGRPTTRWVSDDAQQIGVGKNFGGFHEECGIAGMADGRAVKLSNSIDRTILARMVQIHSAD